MIRVRLACGLRFIADGYTLDYEHRVARFTNAFGEEGKVAIVPFENIAWIEEGGDLDNI